MFLNKCGFPFTYTSYIYKVCDKYINFPNCLVNRVTWVFSFLKQFFSTLKKVQFLFSFIFSHINLYYEATDPFGANNSSINPVAWFTPFLTIPWPLEVFLPHLTPSLWSPQMATLSPFSLSCTSLICGILKSILSYWLDMIQSPQIL